MMFLSKKVALIYFIIKSGNYYPIHGTIVRQEVPHLVKTWRPVKQTLFLTKSGYIFDVN